MINTFLLQAQDFKACPRQISIVVQNRLLLLLA